MPLGGYVVYEEPKLYRVPDLLDEEGFIEYMRSTYSVEIMFFHPETPYIEATMETLDG